MANGSAALPVALEPSAGEKIKASIAAATLDAAIALGRGVMARANGGLDPATRQAGGDTIAKLYELQEQTAGTLDFEAVVRGAGGEKLRQAIEECIDDAAGGPHDAAAIEQALDYLVGEMLDSILVIVGKVTALEAEWARAPDSARMPL